MHLPLRYQDLNRYMIKRFHREKLVQEQLNDEETIKKRQFLLKKNDVRNNKKMTKNDQKTTISFEKKRCNKRQKTAIKRSFFTRKRRLKRRKPMKTKKTKTKRRKRRQNDKEEEFLQKYCRFFVVVLNTGSQWISLPENMRPNTILSAVIH